jgi:hypothetical protein
MVNALVYLHDPIPKTPENPVSGIDPLGTARKLHVRKKKSDSY